MHVTNTTWVVYENLPLSHMACCAPVGSWPQLISGCRENTCRLVGQYFSLSLKLVLTKNERGFI